ncbi:MAG TPA: hypothetical protein VFO36_05005, partial [Nitrospiraceae bacterium]|nr:hypothetical protein [Nitrospiraceae bacterium]
LWLVTHHPEIDLGAYTLVSREENPDVYEQIRRAWKELVKRSPENSAYREQAARFVTNEAPDDAEALYRDGASLEPAEAKWPEHLGNLLIRRSRSATDEVTASTLAGEAVHAFERAYELESWDFARHKLQLSIARAAVAAGRLDVATAAAGAVLRDAPQFERTWLYGNAVHWGHIVLGKVARLQSEVESACRELGLAGATRGSPQLDSFGPDLELAQSLLDLGRTDVVLDYLTQCKRFWKTGRFALDQWIHQISSGERPKMKLS